MNRYSGDEGFVILDVILGAAILILLMGFIQYTMLESKRINTVEHRLVADILLREQLDAAEIEGKADRQVEINGIMYNLSTEVQTENTNQREIIGKCHWMDYGREYTLEQKRFIKE